MSKCCIYCGSLLDEDDIICPLCGTLNNENKN